MIGIEGARMTCPYLKEIQMVFCGAYPVKKLVPTDRVTTASTCEGAFRGCELFRDAMAQATRSLDVPEPGEPVCLGPGPSCPKGEKS
jgi:hypothetical protein